jgi:long-chain acyl-CoA synthetase
VSGAALHPTACLLAAAAAQGEARALTFYRGRTRVTGRSWATLVDDVARASAGLAALGVGRGDRVALASPNRVEVPVALLALWRLGAIAVPLNATLRDDWRHIVHHAGVRGALVAPELADGLAGESLAFVRRIDEPWPGAAPTPPLRDDPEAAAILLYTSGTTGQPKGVLLSQRSLVANAQMMAARFALSQTTQLAVLPLYHAHALGFGFLTALVSGGHLVFTDTFDPWLWAELVRAESVEVASVVPTLLTLLAQARVTAESLPSLRALLVSSAPLPPDLARTVEARTRLPLAHGWGLSEITNFACATGPLDAEARARLLLGGEVPSVGAALDGTAVEVRDARGQPVADSARGELWVRSPSRMRGYYHDDDATCAVLDGDWLRTGDEGCVRVVDGARHVFISGRIKELIIRDGEKCSPLEIEQRLAAELPDLAPHLCVVGFTHALRGEEIGAYLELPSVSEAVRTRILQCVERLPVERRPKIILHGAAPIPRTHTGKVQRRKLIAWFDDYGDCRGPTRLLPVNTR